MWRREAGFLGSYWLLLLFFLSTQHGAAKEICAPPVDAWSIFNVWSEAIFAIPEAHMKLVNVTSRPSALLEPLCTVERLAPLSLLRLAHNLGQCEKQVVALGAARGGGITNVAGRVACATDEVCYVRASPFASPCVTLPDGVYDDLLLRGAEENIDDKFGFRGVTPAMLGAIMGRKLEQPDRLRPWEDAFNAAGDALFRGALPPWLQETVRSQYGANRGGALVQFLDDSGARSSATRAAPLLLPRYPVYLLLGVAITLLTEPLVENRAFQYTVAAGLGAGGFLVLALVVVVAFVDRVAKSARQMTPFGSYAYSVSTLLLPLGFFGMQGAVLSFFGTFLWGMLAFYDRGFEHDDFPAFLHGLPGGEHAGKVYFGLGALLGVALERAFLVFLWPAWHFREEGLNVARCGQLYLDRLLSAAGVACFLHASSSLEVSLLLAFLSLRGVRETISHMALTLYLAEHRSPYLANGGNLQSVEEYERVGKSTTQRELAKLQAYLNSQYQQQQQRGRSSLGAIAFGEQTARRLEQFRQGAPHAERLRDDFDDESQRGAWAKRLTQRLLTASILVAVIAAGAYTFLEEEV